MKMDLALFLLAFTLFWKSCQGVRCYKCIPEKLQYVRTPPCSHFNYSDEFIVECKSSTMCFKRETTLDLGNGHFAEASPSSLKETLTPVVTTSQVRGCAAQTMSGDQRKINGKWTQVHEVYDVYKEACEEHPSDYQHATKTIDCYCRGDLCNSANNLRLPLASLVTTILCFFIS